MPPKKKQKVDSEEYNKICINHFSSSNKQNFVNLFQADINLSLYCVSDVFSYLKKFYINSGL